MRGTDRLVLCLADERSHHDLRWTANASSVALVRVSHPRKQEAAHADPLRGAALGRGGRAPALELRTRPGKRTARGTIERTTRLKQGSPAGSTRVEATSSASFEGVSLHAEAQGTFQHDAQRLPKGGHSSHSRSALGFKEAP